MKNKKLSIWPKGCLECVPVCPGFCGDNTVCNFANHNPICSCKPGFQGNADVGTESNESEQFKTQKGKSVHVMKAAEGSTENFRSSEISELNYSVFVDVSPMVLTAMSKAWDRFRNPH